MVSERQNRPAVTADAEQQEAVKRRTRFAAAEAGEIEAIAALLVQQPGLINATTRLQVINVRS